MNQTNAPYGYYYGNEADQYTFYRIPKMLFTNDRFKNLSSDAKVLYGLMLDRMGLSVKSGWTDDSDRVYIIFTLEQVQEAMNCKHDKAVKILAELDTAKGVGLIERIRQGQGKPAIIYVRKFYDVKKPETKQETEPVENAGDSNEESGQNQDFGKTDVCTSALSAPAEVKTSEKPKSRLRKNRNQDFGKTDAINNDNNNNDYSDTEIQSINPSTPTTATPKRESKPPDGGIDRMDGNKYDVYREIIKDNIEYDSLCDYYSDDEAVTEILELLVETVCTTRDCIRIGKEDLPVNVVKSRMLKLTSQHIEYVLDCIKKNTTKVRNIKAYLLTSLYNAPATMEHFYTTAVNHDLYGNSNSQTGVGQDD